MIPKQNLTIQKAELSQLYTENRNLTAELIEMSRKSDSSEFTDIATAADMLILLQDRVEFLRQELRYTQDKLQHITAEAEIEREKQTVARKIANTNPAQLEVQLEDARRVKAALLQDYRQLRADFGRQVRDLKDRTSQQRAKFLTNL